MRRLNGMCGNSTDPSGNIGSVVISSSCHDVGMSILTTTTEAEATGLVAELYDDDLQDLGYVPSHTKVMAMNPEAVKAFEQLIRAVAGPMNKRRYELITLAAAEAIGSQACRVAHSRKSLKYM